jgi:hypothetical protein
MRRPGFGRSRIVQGVSDLALCILLTPIAARAQTSPDAAPPAAQPQAEQRPTPHRENRLYLGMWTIHLREPVLTLRNNWAVGFTTHGYFGATFLNSYGNRAFAGGLQRTIVATAPDPIGAAFGFRLGFITGYDGRLMRLARETPVLPLVQPFVRIDVRRVGVEVSYTFVVVSIGMSYRF